MAKREWLVAAPAKRDRFYSSLPIEMIEEIEAFVSFVQSQQPGAEREYIIEKMFSDFFSPQRWVIQQFREYQSAMSDDARNTSGANEHATPDGSDEGFDDFDAKTTPPSALAHTPTTNTHTAANDAIAS